MLQARKFKSFWNVLRNGKGGGEEGKEEEKVKKTVIGLLKSAVGVEERLRDCIAQEVEQSFKSLARKTVESFLGLEGRGNHLLALALGLRLVSTTDIASFPPLLRFSQFGSSTTSCGETRMDFRWKCSIPN